MKGDFMTLRKRAFAEFFGTFWLVFGGCGAAVIAAGFPALGIGFAGVALAFGLTVLTMVYAVGHISGAHLNPAVTVGLATAGRFPWGNAIPYVVAQLAGGFVGAGAVLLIASTMPGDYSAAEGGLGANGFGEHSPGGYAAA